MPGVRPPSWQYIATIARSPPHKQKGRRLAAPPSLDQQKLFEA
jgi:hypothetical protein